MNYKRFGAAILCACLLLGTGAREVVCAAEAVDWRTDTAMGGYDAQNDDKFVAFRPTAATTSAGTKLLAYYGTKTSVTFPKTFGDYTVTVVSDEFSSNSYNISTLKKISYTSIKIPSGYTTIESGAFSNQTKLYRIQIPATVKTIASDAFTGCDLTKLTIVAPYGSYAETFANENGINYSNSTALKVVPGSKTMYVGQSKTIAVLNNSKTVTWKSSKTSVASVDKNGVVTAKKKGTTVITATINGKSYTYTFTVLERTAANVLKVIKATYVKMAMSDYERALAATKWVSENIDTTGTSADYKTALETGSGNTIAAANAYKQILKQCGMTSTVISATAENSVIIANKAYNASTLSSATGVDKTYTTTKVGSVTLNKRIMTLKVGKTGTFKATGASASYTWTSSNKKVATITKSGKVTAKGAGSCTMTFTMSGKTYKCTVRVKK